MFVIINAIKIAIGYNENLKSLNNFMTVNKFNNV